MIYLAIVHPQPVYRKALSLLLSLEVEETSITATTSGIRDLIHNHRETLVDVVIWSIPGHHAMSPAARLIKECFPLCKILVMVPSRNVVYAGLLETLGADLVIPDDCQIPDLVKAILKIHETYSPPPSSNHVQEPNPTNKEKVNQLREAKVFQLKQKGYSVDEIALKLKIPKAEITDLTNRREQGLNKPPEGEEHTN